MRISQINKIENDHSNAHWMADKVWKSKLGDRYVLSEYWVSLYSCEKTTVLSSNLTLSRDSPTKK